MGYGSNRGRPSEIGRPGRFRRAVRRRDVAGALLRGAAAPELAEIGTPGWDFEQALGRRGPTRHA